MPFCPECEAEYVEGIAECADCQTMLVDQLTVDDDASPDASGAASGDNMFVTVFEGGSPFDMRMAKGLLESSGFHVEILGGNDPMNPTPTGIQVRKDELEEAKELLENPGDLEDEDSDEFSKDFNKW